MRKVCFLIGNLNLSGGTERVTTLIVNELAKQQYDVSVLNLVDGSDPFFDLHDNVKTHSLYDEDISFKKKYVSAVWKIRRFVQRHQIDTFIVVDSISCMFTAPALYGLKVNHICWEHFNFNVNLGLKSRDLGRKLAAKYCDHIVTLTKRDKELWKQGLRSINAKIVPIANPTPYENIEHIPSIESKTILSLGRLTYQKGFDLLIEAWAQVCHVNDDWMLQIIGSGEDEKALKDQAKLLDVFDRINFIPVTRDVEYYYKTSAFYCLSSRFEGLPMVLLEAQAYGLPIIAFDCDTGPSDLIDDGINGWLVPDQNIHILTNTILKSISISSDAYDNLVKNSSFKSKAFMIDKIILEWKKII